MGGDRGSALSAPYATKEVIISRLRGRDWWRGTPAGVNLAVAKEIREAERQQPAAQRGLCSKSQSGADVCSGVMSGGVLVAATEAGAKSRVVGSDGYAANVCEEAWAEFAHFRSMPLAVGAVNDARVLWVKSFTSATL